MNPSKLELRDLLYISKICFEELRTNMKVEYLRFFYVLRGWIKLLQEITECQSGNMTIIYHGDDSEISLHWEKLLLIEFDGLLLKWTVQ